MRQKWDEQICDCLENRDRDWIECGWLVQQARYSSRHVVRRHRCNNSRTKRPSVPKFGKKVPHLRQDSHIRTNGQRSGLETGGGIPCRPNPAATLLVIQSVLLDVMSNQVYIVPEYLPIKCLTRMTLGLVSILLPCVWPSEQSPVRSAPHTRVLRLICCFDVPKLVYTDEAITLVFHSHLSTVSKRLAVLSNRVHRLVALFLSCVSILTSDIDTANLSARLSVRPSVTFPYQIKRLNISS